MIQCFSLSPVLLVDVRQYFAIHMLHGVMIAYLRLSKHIVDRRVRAAYLLIRRHLTQSSRVSIVPLFSRTEGDLVPMNEAKIEAKTCTVAGKQETSVGEGERDKVSHKEF